MKYRRQDKNFHAQYTIDDPVLISQIDELKLDLHKPTADIKEDIQALHKSGQIKIVNEFELSRTVKSKRIPKADKFIKPFLEDYLKNYIERQTSTYDKVISNVKKCLKIVFDEYASIKLLDKHTDNKRASLLCVDVTAVKHKWKRSDYTMLVKYYEFLIGDTEIVTSTTPIEGEVVPTDDKETQETQKCYTAKAVTDDCMCDPCECDPCECGLVIIPEGVETALLSDPEVKVKNQLPADSVARVAPERSESNDDRSDLQRTLESKLGEIMTKVNHSEEKEDSISLGEVGEWA